MSTGEILEQAARQACAIATQRSYLRPNAVDSLTGKNSGDNTGIDFPTLHFHEWDTDSIQVQSCSSRVAAARTSETSTSCPTAKLSAGRDLEGVRKVVLDAVFQAQGKGCAPGVLGVTVGGDRGSGYLKAKQALLRKLDEPNPDPTLDAFEKRLLQD